MEDWYTGRQLRAARALLDISQLDLAEYAVVSVGTIRHMESCDGPVLSYTDTIKKVRKTLERMGVEFLADEHGHGVGVKLKPIRPRSKSRRSSYGS